MKIYHTCTSVSDLNRAREEAPSFEHGLGWIPEKTSPKATPYFVDNGAYREHAENEPWDWQQWREALDKAAENDSQPDFVVLPDRYGDWEITRLRHESYLPWVRDRGLSFYAAAQPGGGVEEMVRYAVAVGAEGVFIGGTGGFKKEYAAQLVMTAHDYGLQAHIGKPGKRLTWARDLGADSVDSSSIVRNGYWDRLRKLEACPSTEDPTLVESVAVTDGGPDG